MIYFFFFLKKNNKITVVERSEMYFCAGVCEISVALANAQFISFNSLIDCCVFMVRLWLPSLGCHCACVAPCRAVPSPLSTPEMPPGDVQGSPRGGDGYCCMARCLLPARATSSRSQDGWTDGFSLCGFLTEEEVQTRQEGKRCPVPLSCTFLQALTYP